MLQRAHRTAATQVLEYESRRVSGRTERVEDMTLSRPSGSVRADSFRGFSRHQPLDVHHRRRPDRRNDPASALEFSFFLSIPTMAAATVNEFYKTIIRHKGEGGTTLPPVDDDHHHGSLLAIGYMYRSSSRMARRCQWFMGWVRRSGFPPFAIYRIIVGIAVLIWAWSRCGAAEPWFTISKRADIHSSALSNFIFNTQITH